MSTDSAAASDTIDHAVDHHEAHDDHGHPSDRTYVMIALVLAVITAIETLTYFESAIEFGPFLVPILIIAMAIKFYLVVAYFMHLKFDHPRLRQMFVTGVILAIIVYAIMMFAFEIFTNTTFPN